jgi:hypothetical protein
VIDESRDVAANVRVTHPAAVHREAPDFAAFQVLRFAFETFSMINQLAGIVDNTGVLGDRFPREHAPPMELRTATDEFWTRAGSGLR